MQHSFTLPPLQWRQQESPPFITLQRLLRFYRHHLFCNEFKSTISQFLVLWIGDYARAFLPQENKMFVPLFIMQRHFISTHFILPSRHLVKRTH